MTDLKPCPFCGAQDIFVREKPNNSDAECHQCGCVAGLSRWNTRAALTAQAVTDDCFICGGDGAVSDYNGEQSAGTVECSNCDGTGKRTATRSPDAGLLKALEEAFSIADTEIQKPGDVDTRYRALKRTWLTLKETLAAHKAAARAGGCEK